MSKKVVGIDYVRDFFKGKTVCVIGGGPSGFNNKGDFIDSHDIVVRISNYASDEGRLGKRCDVHYSFYGSSIGKTREQLEKDGVRLHMCKCPDSRPIPEEYQWWHKKNRKMEGIDYTYIYRLREGFWFAPVYIPSDDRFLQIFKSIDNHQPTTGYACLYEVLSFDTRSVYITGFDFFSSDMHFDSSGRLVKWGRHDRNKEDPIRHEPDIEARELSKMICGRRDVSYDDAFLSVINKFKGVQS